MKLWQGGAHTQDALTRQYSVVTTLGVRRRECRDIHSCRGGAALSEGIDQVRVVHAVDGVVQASDVAVVHAHSIGGPREFLEGVLMVTTPTVEKKIKTSKN